MYTLICEKSVTVMVGQTKLSLVMCKLKSNDASFVREGCLALVKNEPKPEILQCWQVVSSEEKIVIPVDEIEDISGFDSSRTDLFYPPFDDE